MRSYNEKKVHCPYNEKHIMPKNRLIWHLAMVCEDQKKYKDLFETCPYFALHIIKKEMMEEHKNQCKYRPKETVHIEESKQEQQKLEACFNWGSEAGEQQYNNEFDSAPQIIIGWNDQNNELWWGNNSQENLDKNDKTIKEQKNSLQNVITDLVNEVIEKIQAVDLKNN